ncbi:MAG: serine hydrolase [Mycobacterium sp.]|jgi:hypothetical protein|nr:serine hydrolase [Mycobacterium sp.]
MINRAAAAAIAVVLLMTGCGSRSSESHPQRLSDAPPNEVSGVDIPQGRVNDAIGKLDGLVADLMGSSGIPGMAVAVVHRGKLCTPRDLVSGTYARATR